MIKINNEYYIDTIEQKKEGVNPLYIYLVLKSRIRVNPKRMK